MLAGFKVRLINELFELQGRRSKLNEFISSEKFNELECKSKELMKKQQSVMCEYEYILLQRLKDLGVDVKSLE